MGYLFLLRCYVRYKHGTRDGKNDNVTSRNVTKLQMFPQFSGLKTNMVVFVGTPTFRRVALWVAMETMHLNIARIIFFPGDKFFGACLGSQ